MLRIAVAKPRDWGFVALLGAAVCTVVRLDSRDGDTGRAACFGAAVCDAALGPFGCEEVFALGSPALAGTGSVTGAGFEALGWGRGGGGGGAFWALFG